ncbi:MAG: hypothetical protein Q4F95_15625 [Oscillospiraceae bacterium]|nr:hypothetical protein [Oscillospiraceae bacterium]
MNIEKIIAQIAKIDYSVMDIDEYLENRDLEEFDNEWTNIYEQIDKTKIPEEIVKQSDQYREQVFMIIDEMTGGSELSEYISDDMELLVFADYLNISSDWLKKFTQKYENGELPAGIL